MGEGADKVARALLDLQPSAILDLFIIYPDRVDKPNTYYPVHNGSVFKKGIVWQGQTYMPIGMEIENFEMSADGRVNRPKIKISNKDYYMTNLLRSNDDFVNARVVRKRTFVKFLDDENFDGGNPFSSADSRAELSRQEYIVSQKIQENKIYVELELTSPIDLDNFDVNSRRIMGKYCYWNYRGNGCQYEGRPVQKDNGELFTDISGNVISFNGDFQRNDPDAEYAQTRQYTTGDLVYVKNNRIKIHDPYGIEQPRPVLNYYIAKTDCLNLHPESNPSFWDKDGCNKKLSSCKQRFSPSLFVERFIGSKDYTKPVSKLVGSFNNKNYFLTPKDDNGARNTLSGNNWTVVLSYAAMKESTTYAGFLQTNIQDRYSGLNVFDFDNYFYSSFKTADDSERTVKSASPYQDDEKGSPFVISKSGNSIITSQPKRPNRRVTTYASEFSGNHDVFHVGANQWRTSGVNISPDLTVEAVLLFTKALSEDEINSIFVRDIESTLRIVSWDDVNQDLKPSVKDWWEGKYISGTTKGIENRKRAWNPLLFSGASQDFQKTVDYTINQTVLVPSEEGAKNLPFGGFPGTDGFGFDR